MHDPEPTTPIDGRVEVDQRPKFSVTTIHVDRPCRPYVAADGQRPRCTENRGGDFYTDCESCLGCDVPHGAAPTLFAYVEHQGGRWHCVFTRRPTTPEDVEQAIDAMCGSEVCGIRYGGADPEILRRIASRGRDAHGTTDRPPP